MKYSTRNFRMNLKEALDRVAAGKEVQIVRGKEVFEVYCAGIHKAKKKAKASPSKVTKMFDHKYGCGCKVAGKKLCPKHGRV